MLNTGGAQIFGPGPVISQSTSVQPEMRGSAYLAPPGPGITGAASSAPVISGGGSTPVTPATAAPTIVGGGTMVPNIGKE